MPWLTPDSIPEDGDCRPLFIPASTAWLALVSGALTELTKPYNWQKFGTLTIDETVAEMQTIIDNYYNSPCAMCLTPGDYRVTRISPTGHIEELAPDGTWEAATGDYLIPPPAARTEGTQPDQNCLAAKNATAAIKLLYQDLSTSYASEFNTDEAITAFIAAAIAAIGFEFAPVTWSIAATGFVIFEALFRALQYVVADLWTDAFSNEFECLLLGCVINTAGVVTFDWDCFNSSLLRQTNDMGLSEVQMRLYVQIGYILHFIGGVDGLNLAARTTSVTDDICNCGCEHCFMIDFELSDGSEHGFVLQGGVYNTGCCMEGAAVGPDTSDVYGYWAFPSTVKVCRAEMTFSKIGSAGSDGVNHFNALNPAAGYSTTIVASDNSDPVDASGGTITKGFDVNLMCAGIGFDVNMGSFSATPCQIYTLKITYEGSEIFGGDNC